MLPTCRLCLTTINEDDCIVVSNDEQSMQIKEMLRVCLPNINLELLRHFVVCSWCINDLQNAYVFVNRCLHSEELILNYIQTIAEDGAVDMFCNVNVDSMIDRQLQLDLAASSTVNENGVAEMVISVKEVAGQDENEDASCADNENDDQDQEQKNMGTDENDPNILNRTFRVNKICYRCGVCNNSFWDICSFQEHLLVHNLTECDGHSTTYECSEINVRDHTYASSSADTPQNSTPETNATPNDSATDDIGKKESLTCEKCNSKFKTKTTMKIHCKKNICSKYVCNICNTKFRKPSLLERHMKTAHA